MEELAQLAAVPTQIITPRESKPIISVVQDIATGLYRLTKSHVKVSEKQLFNLLATNTKFKGFVPKPQIEQDGVSYWSGRQVLSQIFPERLNIEIKDEDQYDDNKSAEENKEFVTSIKCGELVSGKISKDVYQARTRGVIHSVYNEYGPDETRQLFDNTQRLICDWLVYNGFSCGVSDVIVPLKAQEDFKVIIHDMKKEVYGKIREIHESKFENKSTKNNHEYFEMQVNKVLNDAINKVGKEGVDKIDENHNRLINMIKSKSKGNKINVSQMIGCVGQQNVDGHRIPYGFDDRTLPHYTKYDDGPESRGFVENSFVKGLTPQEFFFHAMGGREGLIDTAVNSVTGDTPLVIIEDGKPKYIEIGEWVDSLLSDNTGNIKYVPEQANLEMLTLSKKTYIPTTDANGNVTWGELTAVTRHDPSAKLYKIVTESGRKVIVAESKSLLIWSESSMTFEMKHSPDVKVGDCVPVTVDLPDPPVKYDNSSFTHDRGVTIGKELHECDHIPSYIYNSPKDFIKSVVAGYFTEESTTAITEKLANGLSVLLSRLGMVANLNGERVSVWGKYRQHNNVAIDPIREITILNNDDYPKLYDVTVPSTLNFMIANGLNVLDTSETGYIQRKLVKAMEDCKVSFDMSVRNASGVIIQYLYGEDGMDACKLETQTIPTIDMEIDKLQSIYNLVEGVKDFKTVLYDEVYKKLEKNKKRFEDRMQKHYEQVLEDKEHIVMKVFGGKKETSITYPVSLYRIINNVQQMNIKYGCNVSHDLDPEYVLDQLDKLCKELVVSKRYPGNRIFQTLLRAYLSPKRAILMYRLSRKSFDAIVDQVKFRFYESLAHPSDMVGVVAAQSIGEPATQLVLNSVAYDTELLLNFDGVLKRAKIGEYIDAQMERATKIEEHPNDTKLAWLSEKTTVLSCDKDGKVDWKRIEAVTRHPVVNKDGTNTVLEVTTKSGRSVIATKGKSFLKRVNNEIVACNGEDLRVGDYLPVSTILPIDDSMIVQELDLSLYLPKTEYIYMSEIDKGIHFATKDGKKKPPYWKNHHGKDFVTPYNRSDSFYAAWISGIKGHTRDVKPNCVYPVCCGGTAGIQTHIPEKLLLDTEFGFFVGAYLSEGMTCSSGDAANENKSEHHVLISNVDPIFNKRITNFVDKLGAKYHWDDRYINDGHSVTCRIHSSILAELMSKMCGNGSPNKRIPSIMLQAPKSFLEGLIDGYFSGDGSVDKHENQVSAYSVSKGLLEDIQQILTGFGVETYMRYNSNTNVKEKRPEAVILEGWTLVASGRAAVKFSRTFTNIIDYKQVQLDRIACNTSTYERSDIVPNVVLEVGGEINLTRKHAEDLYKKSSNEKDKDVLRRIMEEDIMYDQVVNIKEVVNPTPYVYDLTVEETRTFNLYSGLGCFDTFHSAGISSASKAVRGVPRLNELLAVSKSIKTPIMKIHLNESVKRDLTKCIDIMNNIRTIRFKDIVSSSKIYFDPNDFKTNIPEDSAFIQLYKDFVGQECLQNVSPWLLRLEFDRTKMLDYKLDMITVHYVLTNFYEQTISCIFPDDNAEQLIMRIKITQDKDQQSDDLLTELKALEHNILENVVIKGIKNIERVAIDEQTTTLYDPDVKTFNSINECVIYTSGTNMRDVLANPVVDAPRTITNDVNEIYEYLGIEAARQALYNEIVDVMDSISINYRHVALLVDVMTNRGTILSVNRHGINRGDIGPLAKCSFEETTDKLIKAGIFAEHDKINGVSANVMLGQIAPCGTGDVDVMMDETLLMQMQVVKEEEYDEAENEESINEACKSEALKTNMNMQLNATGTTIARKEDNEFVLLDD